MSVAPYRVIKQLLVACTLAALLIGTSSPALASDEAHTAPGPEDELIDLLSTGHEAIDLESRKGQPITAVVFFATWNPKSESVLKTMVKMVDQYRDKGFAILAINAESEEPKPNFDATLEAYMAKIGPNYAVLQDEGLSVYRAWSVRAMPSTFLLDGSLEMIETYAGAPYSFEEDLIAQIEKALGIAAPEAAEEDKGPERYQADRNSMLGYGMASKLGERGRTSKALRKIKEVQRKDPLFPDAFSLEGRLMLGDKKTMKKPEKIEEMKKAFNISAELNPLLPMALLGQARMALLEDDTQKASNLLTKALEQKGWGFSDKPEAEATAKILADIEKAEDLKATLETHLDDLLLLRKHKKVTMRKSLPPAEKKAE